MDRFDLVVANCNRTPVFWRGFARVHGFRADRDRLIVMDCSTDPQRELAAWLTGARAAGIPESAVVFFRRRNWNLNHGAQLDYVRLLGDARLSRPRWAFFAQDHYFNVDELVKGDTIPEDARVDLDDIDAFLDAHPAHVWFCARNGFRVTATVPPDVAPRLVDNRVHVAGSTDLTFCIDGGNFCCDPGALLEHHRQNPGLFVAGNGSYDFCHVWESRLAKILYDRGFAFHEASRGLTFRTIAELKARHPHGSGGPWAYFYTFPAAYFFYGQDLWRYRFKPHPIYVRAYARFLQAELRADWDASIERLYPLR